MPDWLRSVPIEQASVLVPLYLVAAALVAVLLLPTGGVRGALRTRAGVSALAALAGTAVGWTLVWWVVDVQDVFGAPASDVVRGAVAAAGGGIGVALANLVRTRWWRKVVALVAVPVFVLAGGAIVNRDVAYYPRFGDVFGDTGVRSLPVEAAGDVRGPLARWRPPAGMPANGRVGTVTIPGTVSRWHGRAAWVYLPPAALVRSPPKLPVVVAFSGQPGGPSDLFLAGDLQQPLDSIAAAHHGVAPIVVVPDQLGAADRNPMCIDSRLGDVSTYVTVDVRDWILHHLPASTQRREWTVAGFSEGATCAVQFATGDPALFGSFIAVAPELGPRNGSVGHTIRVGWHGDRKAFEAAQPIATMQRTKHYPATRAVFSVGEDDRRYGTDAGVLAPVARRVGMQVSYRVLIGLAHNWNTGAAGLRYGLSQLVGWWRLP